MKLTPFVNQEVTINTSKSLFIHSERVMACGLSSSHLLNVDFAVAQVDFQITCADGHAENSEKYQ